MIFFKKNKPKEEKVRKDIFKAFDDMFNQLMQEIDEELKGFEELKEQFVSFKITIDKDGKIKYETKVPYNLAKKLIEKAQKEGKSVTQAIQEAIQQYIGEESNTS